MMRWLLLVCVCLAATAAHSLQAQMRFEGTLHYRLAYSGKYLNRVDTAFADSLVVKMKGHWLLAEYYGTRHPGEIMGRVLIDADSNIVYKLFDSLQIAQRQIMELEASPYREFARIPFQKYSKPERIAGYDCQRVSGAVELPMSGGKCQFTMWLWEDFKAPGFMDAESDLNFVSLGGIPGQKGIVLKKRIVLPELGLNMTQTCTRVDMNLLDLSTFMIPREYTVGDFFPLEELPTREEQKPRPRLHITPRRLALPGKPTEAPNAPNAPNATTEAEAVD